MKLLTITFVLLLLIIVLIANLGLGSMFFPFMYEVPGADKVGHFLLIGILSFLVNYVLRARSFTIFSRSVLQGSIIILIFVTIEEFSQIFLSSRAFSIMDLLFDYLGIFVFGFIARYVLTHQRLSNETRTTNSPSKNESD